VIEGSSGTLLIVGEHSAAGVAVAAAVAVAVAVVVGVGVGETATAALVDITMNRRAIRFW
jgi:hypothetical protein